MKKIHPDSSQGAGVGRARPQKAGGAVDPRRRPPLRGPERAAGGDGDAPIPPIQTSAAYDAMEKALKNARIKKPEIIGDDGPAPVPPIQIAAGYEAAEAAQKGAVRGKGRALVVPEEDTDDVVVGRHPGEERALDGSPFSSSLPESSPTSTQGGGAVGIDIRPAPDDGNDAELTEPGTPVLEATLVEEDVYDATVVPAEDTGGSLLAKQSPININSDRRMWKYILVICLLAVVGLVMFVIVRRMQST